MAVRISAGIAGAALVPLLVSACGPADKTPALPAAGATPVTTSSVPPVVRSPVSINAEMVMVLDHAAHQLWNAEREGKAPRTDADWENLAEHATQVASAGALIRLEGSGPNDRTFVAQPEWQKFAEQVSAAGLAALTAAEAKNKDALVTANGQLVEACESCHKRFKPALPSEGITHVHVD